MCHVTHHQTEGVVTLVICVSRGRTYWLISRVSDPHIPLESGNDEDPRVARNDAFNAFRLHCEQFNGEQS